MDDQKRENAEAAEQLNKMLESAAKPNSDVRPPVIYEVRHDGPLEVHTVTIHQTDMVRAAKYVDAPKYKMLSEMNQASASVAALALIVKAIEVQQSETEEEPKI